MTGYDKDEIMDFILSNADSEYRDFHSRLTRTNYKLNGVRVPILRKYAKQLSKCADIDKFFDEEPPCFEFCMLKGMTLAFLKVGDDKFFGLMKKYIADIDDWSLTDVACCTIHRKDGAYLQQSLELAQSQDIWQARWGIVAIMTNFYDKDDVILQAVKGCKAKDYYVDMAIAWLIQVLCVKNIDMAKMLLQSDFVSDTVKKYADRKIKDSFRITKEDKLYLCSLIK